MRIIMLRTAVLPDQPGPHLWTPHYSLLQLSPDYRDITMFKQNRCESNVCVCVCVCVPNLPYA